MTRAATATQCFFDFHGVGVSVSAHEQIVIDAIELRLHDFRNGALTDPGLRLEFTSDARGDPPRPSGTARPVYDTPHGTLHYFPDADLLCGRLGGVELRCEAGRGSAVLRSPKYIGHDLYLATHPLATISLMELLEHRGLFALHAACVATEAGQGILLAGASGAGKSTLALALADSGVRFLSDDIVFLAPDPDPDMVRVLGFADTVGLTDQAVAQIPVLRELRDEPPAAGFPKRLHRIEDLFGTPALPACEPVALVFPVVSPGEPSEIAPLDAGEAMLRLVPDVLLTDATSTAAHLRAIAALLKQVSCYTLRSGSDLERAAALVRALV
jgi:hypothetical protein